MSATAPSARQAARALAALAVDPVGLKGMTVHAHVGPARAAFEVALPKIPGPLRRIPPSVSDTQLFGGLNIAATLAEGRPVTDAGLEGTAATLVIPMAERISPGRAARLARILDRDVGHLLILLDEGTADDDAIPTSLTDRLAFDVDLSDVSATGARFLMPAPADIQNARAHLDHITTPTDAVEALTAITARFGIDSLRAPFLALRTARAFAALDRCDTIEEAHLREAAEMVFPSRARILPAPDDDPTVQNTPDTEGAPGDREKADAGTLPTEMMVDAVAALLPPDLLEQKHCRSRSRSRTSGSGAGSKRTRNRRGRPLPSRPGKPDGRNRIDPVATLRVAAPWQRLRQRNIEGDRRIIIHPSDIRIRRFEERSDRLLIFTVDASGSSAAARLAEAKGAVELLLAQAYAKRDQVALIAFRGQTADLLLPPTRSLVQGKRRLAALPGGGGTPLAAGLQAAASLMQLSQRRGLHPMLALLTDARANIGLDGTADRTAAWSDATTVAKQIRALNLSSVVVDISIRPGEQAALLASDLGGDYLALPRADAQRISGAVDTALGD